MRKINEVARLKASVLSVRQITRSCDVARSTVAEYLDRVEERNKGPMLHDSAGSTA